MPISEQRKIAGLVILVILLIFVYANCMMADAAAAQECASFSHAIGCVPCRPTSRQSVENIIIAREHKENLRVRHTRKLSAAVALGVMRGAIIGAVLGTEASIVEGMVSIGALNGVLYWLSERINGHVPPKI